METSKGPASTMWGNGSCRPKNSQPRMNGVRKVQVIRQSCFAMKARESAKHLSGNENGFREKKKER